MDAVFKHYGVCDDIADNIAQDVHSSHLKKVHKELFYEQIWWRWVHRHCGLDYVYWLYWYSDDVGPSPLYYPLTITISKTGRIERHDDDPWHFIFFN